MSTSDRAGDKAGNKEGDNAGEASMDEILASIRKIIADDPSGSRSGPDQRAVNPLFESVAPPYRALDASENSGPLLPPAPRFDDALRAATESARATPNDPTPAPPQFRRRPFIDQALSELLDDPQPEMTPSPPAMQAVSTSSADQAVNDLSADVTSAAAFGRPQGAQQSPDPWAAWRNLRNSAVPGAPPTTPESRGESREAVEPRPAPVASDSGVAPNGHAPVSQPVKAEQPPVQSHLFATAKATPDVANTRPAKPSFYPPTAVPPVRHQPATFSAVFPRAHGPSVPGALATEGVSAGTPAAPALSPLNSSTQTPSHAAGLQTPAAEMKMAAAADEALAKLAAGISEATAPADSVQTASPHAPVAHTTAARPTPSADPLPLVNGALAAAPATPASSNGAPASGVEPRAAPAATGPRSLDDMVSDLLRPMLEKWVETNMPRLMEKALRPGTGKDPSSKT